MPGLEDCHSSGPASHTTSCALHRKEPWHGPRYQRSLEPPSTANPVPLARDRELAAWYGWHTRRLGYGRWEFRDPRFTPFAITRPAPALAPRSWAQAALARRIRALGTASPHDRSAGRGV